MYGSRRKLHPAKVKGRGGLWLIFAADFKQIPLKKTLMKTSPARKIRRRIVRGVLITFGIAFLAVGIGVYALIRNAEAQMGRLSFWHSSYKTHLNNVGPDGAADVSEHRVYLFGRKHVLIKASGEGTMPIPGLNKPSTGQYDTRIDRLMAQAKAKLQEGEQSGTLDDGNYAVKWNGTSPYNWQVEIKSL